MAHPLEKRVDLVRRKAASMQRWIALCRVAVTVLAALLLAGVADYFVRSQMPAVRFLFSGLLVGAVCFAVWYWGLPAFRLAWGRIAAARQIERQFPELKDRLSNSIAFAGTSEGAAAAGSLELRRAVIAETESLATHLDFSRALDRRPARHATLLAAGAVVVVAAIGAMFPISSATAVSRLLQPWSNTTWPLRHALAFVDAPTKLAAGADFEAQVVDRNGRLPENVRLLLRYDGQGGSGTETIEMKPIGTKMVHRLESVTRPFAYRAIGGDDRNMPWTEVEVIEAPKLVDFALHVQPPPYTHWPPEQMERVARVLAGSRLTLTGKLDKPAHSVSLRSKSRSSVSMAARLSADGRSFTIPAVSEKPWMAERSDTLTFHVLDENGIEGGQDMRIELQVFADSPPAIAWDRPTDQTFVTPRAVVPLQAIVKDDQAVERVVLKYLRPDATDADEQVVELYSAARDDRPGSSRPPQKRRGDGQTLSIDTTWDLATLGLQPGNVLAVHLEASDLKPQSATTPVRRISVIDDAEFENRMLQQQTSVFTQLAEALRLQREAHGQVTALQFQLEETGRLETRDVDQLQSAELLQRQVDRLLSDPTDGVDARLAALLAELTNNRIDSPNIARRLSDLQARIRHIDREWLVEIGQQLTSALKSARATESDPAGLSPQNAEQAAIAQSLAAAEGRQQQVIGELESLLGELSEWDNFSRLAREVGQIRQQQEKAQQETESLRWKIAAAAGEQPTAEQRAIARQLATRQQDLARRFDKLQGRMAELHTRLEAADPQTARTLVEANELAQRLAIGGQMRQAGRELTEYRVGTGQQTQLAVLKSLGELLDALSSRRDRELLRTVESLQTAQAELDDLRAKQHQLAAIADQAAEQADSEERKRQLMRLTKEQEELQERAEELRRKLERLQARRPAKAAGEGAQSMSRAGEAARNGDAAAASEQAREASRLLDEARQQLQQEIEQAQADLVREQLTRLEQSVAGLIVRQRNVATEVGRLETARDRGRNLPAAQEAALSGVAAEQRLLAEEVAALRAKLVEAAAFVLALDGVEREMQSAATLLSRGVTDRQTLQAAESALNRLEQIVAALKADGGKPPSDSTSQDEGGGSNPQQDGESLVRSLAELRLLAELQAEINRRTAEIEESRKKTGELTHEQAQYVEALAGEQGRLAEMVVDLAEKSTSPSDDVPELPPLDDQMPDAAKSTEGKRGRGKEPATLDEQLLRDLLEKP